MKKCNKCNEEKDLSLFYKRKNGYRNICKPCNRELSRETKKKYMINYRIINSEALKESHKNYEINNKDKRKSYLELNKDKIRERSRNYQRLKCKTDPFFKLKKNVRNLIYKSFSVNKVSKRTKDILGCSFEEFKIHLESKFEPWMNWENRGKYNGELNYGWDIDHIVPISSAKNEEELIRLNHFSNLQPLCSKFNRDIKCDKTV
jgi:hypothetical protein